MKVERVRYQAGSVVAEGALVYDESITEPRPLLLMSPNWFGMTDEAIERTASMAGSKYIGFVADMYGDGKITVGRDGASGYANALRQDFRERRTRIKAAADALACQAMLRKIGDPSRMAAVGFCFGGGNVLELARIGADVGAIVCVHGDLITSEPATSGSIKSRILVLHGTQDPVVPKEHRDAFEQEMDGAGATWQILNFGGLLHSFAEIEACTPGIEVYEASAAAQTYDMIEYFLDRNLR